jgi:glycosyltransferase involved in cell wall biosynthesis
VIPIPRTLFVFRSLPRPAVSVAGVLAGSEALSGTDGSGVLVAEGLARRGHEVACVVLDGRTLSDATFATAPTLADAASWVGNGRIVWVYQGDDVILDRLNEVGLTPSVWAHIHVSQTNRHWLETGRIRDLFTVSDTARIGLLRSRAHGRSGRMYNPLAPAFEASSAASCVPDRFARRRVVFSGHPSTTKGAHRLMRIWAHVRAIDSTATLHLAGTGRLYGDGRPLGPHGISHPDFEAKYVAPLVAKFGSLDAAGVHPCGLLNPQELRALYEQSSLGVVNPNWGDYTETFCCAAVEMLATGLPVFSVARGALPETVGPSGGVHLSNQEEPEREAEELLALLGDTQRLRELGEAGAEYVRREYGLPVTVERWERMLGSPSNIESLIDSWRGPCTTRYWIERTTGMLGLGRLLDWVRDATRAPSTPSQ